MPTELITSSAPARTLCLPDLKPRRRDAVLDALIRCAAASGMVRNPELLLGTLLRRERLYPSAIGKGIAVPHARSIAVCAAQLVVGRSVRGVEWGAPDALPVQLVWLVLAPSEMSAEFFHGLVARAVRAMRLQRQRQRVLESCTSDAVALALRETAS
jgi:mannitol/fructose-specific phosphotransferase system IIA component (Ntr-type)